MSAIPKSKPAATLDKIEKIIASHKIDREKFPVVVVGVRGYYMDTMGVKGKNDRGIYDDAIFLVTPSVFAAFNGNTDPSRYRKGKGTGAGKGMTSLTPGAWPCYIVDTHGGSRPHIALCQRKGVVTVKRDGVNGDYLETGKFGINIHRGGVGTSSEGCQTIPPVQWPSFIDTTQAELKRYKQTLVVYILVEAGPQGALP